MFSIVDHFFSLSEWTEMISEIPAIGIFSVTLETSNSSGTPCGSMTQQRIKQYCIVEDNTDIEDLMSS